MGADPQARQRGGTLRRERELATLAGRQHGVVSRRQLEELGLSRRSVETRCAGGRLHRIHRGVYAVGHARLSESGRWLAAVLAHGEGAILSHRSAAALWGLLRQRQAAVDVTAPRGRAGRNGIIFHECQLHPDDLTVVDAIPVTTACRTLFDLAEVIAPNRLRRAWEEADRLGLLEIRTVEEIIERGWRRHALKPIRPLVRDARLPKDFASPLEGYFSDFCERHGLRAPLTNVMVAGYEVDALWPAERLIVELDGFAFHSHRAAFERDRARDAVLQAAGYRVLRFTYRRLKQDPAGIVRDLRACLS